MSPQPRRRRQTPAPVPQATGAIAGYLPATRPRYVWITCGWTEPSDEVAIDPTDAAAGEPFRVEIRSNLSWAEIDTIDLSGDLSYLELWDRMAPYVRSWNALGRDMATGEIVPVPPPMEAGPEAFRAIEPALSMWLANQLRKVHLGGEERGKESRSPASTDDTPSSARSA